MIILNNPLGHLEKQLKLNFEITSQEVEYLKACYDRVISKVRYCFSKTKNKYYTDGNQCKFDALHSGQYTIFLYFYSKVIYVDSEALASKVYYLNRIMNSVDLFYHVDLPRHFELDHPLGTVLGRAMYGEGFKFSQGCTVGNNKGYYPEIGDNVTMLSNSKILGSCKIGSNVIFSANSFIMDKDVPSNTIVFGVHPNCTLKEMPAKYFC